MPRRLAPYSKCSAEPQPPSPLLPNCNRIRTPVRPPRTSPSTKETKKISLQAHRTCGNEFCIHYNGILTRYIVLRITKMFNLQLNTTDIASIPYTESHAASTNQIEALTLPVIRIAHHIWCHKNRHLRSTLDVTTSSTDVGYNVTHDERRIAPLQSVFHLLLFLLTGLENL